MRTKRSVGESQKLDKLESGPSLKKAGSSDGSNFTFVFTVVVFISAGVASMGWGTAFVSTSLMMAGFLVALLGIALCGWNLVAQVQPDFH